MLNFARARAAVCLWKNESLYAFYGTNSTGKSVSTVERLDLYPPVGVAPVWRVIEVSTHLPGFDVTHAGALQINHEQILLLGGFRDSMFFNNDMIMNRKLIAFNVPTNSTSLFDVSLPADCLVQSQPFVYSNDVYALGAFMSEYGDQPRQNLDNYFVYRIDRSASPQI
jgi:hypothetical protein